MQDCCNISQWRDPSDFSVYDEDDDDAGSVTDESSDSGSDLGSEVMKGYGRGYGNVLSAVNQSCRPFTLENTVNIKRNVRIYPYLPFPPILRLEILDCK